MVVLRGSGGAGWEGFYSREEGGGGGHRPPDLGVGC